MLRCDRFESEPGRVLKDAFRTRVMDKLIAADQALLHRDAAPGTEPVWEVGRGRNVGRSHGRHCLRGPQTLSTEGASAGRRFTDKNILAAVHASFQNRGIVQPISNVVRYSNPLTERH